MTVTDIKDITSFKWATVTGVAPLAIKLDGDSLPLALIPDSLIDPLSLWVGARVRVELSLRKCVIHGAANGGDGLPSGTSLEFAGSVLPAGFLWEDGTVYLRSAYPRLFAAIGTSWNTGGELGTQFRVPNRKGRVGVGRDAAQTEFDVLGETGGAKTHTLSVAEMPSHSHRARIGNVSPGDGSGFRYSNNDTGMGVVQNEATGGGGAHNNLQPYAVFNYIIKV